MMTAQEVKNLKTVPINNRDQIQSATDLQNLYCLVPLKPKVLDRKIKNESCEAYLLYDTVKVGKQGYPEIAPVAFSMYEPVNLRIEDDGEGGTINVYDVLVSQFAMQPWYDIEIAAAWIDYQLSEIYQNNRELPSHKRSAYIKYLIWDVDELNRPLLDELIKLGFYVADYNPDTELVTFMK